MKNIIKMVLCFFLFLMLFGCNKETEIEMDPDTDNMAEQEIIDEYDEEDLKDLESIYDPNGGYEKFSAPYKAYRNFAAKQLMYSYNENDNEIVSPLSLYYAMAILTNGASGKTRKQLENALGMNVQDLNNFLKDLEVQDFRFDPQYEKANAVWFNTADGLKLKGSFKETVQEYYGDNIYEYDFKDGTTVVNEANSWANEKTHGAIQEIVNDSDIDESVAFLILNALALGQEWMYKFDSSQTFYEEFNNRDNSKGIVEMMHQTFVGYWHDDKAQGFSKELFNNAEFVGIIPNLGVDIYDYINTMDGDTLKRFFESYIDYDNVETNDSGCIADRHITNLSFPKFKYEKEYDLEIPFKKCGLKDLFDPSTCYFSEMADGDQSLIDTLYLKFAKQKCSIEVDEEKVVAAAVTAIGGGKGGDGCTIREFVYHDIIFDRPFIYALMTNSEKPLFIGVVTKLGEPVEKAFQIQNITGKINIRSLPSTSGEKLGTYEKGKIIYAFETKEAEGYTWYRIGTDKWVADKNGEWIKVLKAQ